MMLRGLVHGWAALSANILIGWRRPGWPLDHATTRSASLMLETDVLHRAACSGALERMALARIPEA